MFNVFECLVSSVRSGVSLPVEKSNFSALLRLSQELENDEILSSLLGMIKTESLSLEEAIHLLRIGIDLGTAFSGRFGNLRDFVASRFYEIKKEILDDLDLETAQILLSSPSLRIEDEDSLYDFVRSRSENDLRFTSLFEFVYFDYLSVNRIRNFASFVGENFLENLNSGIWRQICRRLILETKLRTEAPHNCRRWTETKFVYDESKKFNGVIAHLTRECGGNVHEKGVVNVKSSSHDTVCWKVVDLELKPSSFYSSLDVEDSWICYDFKERRVIPTTYSLRSYDCSSGWQHLKSWVIEVSNDGYSWTEIDRRDNNKDLNNAFATANFKISRVPSESFRLFRLRQTGKNHRDDYCLYLASLEIFGTLFER